VLVFAALALFAGCGPAPTATRPDPGLKPEGESWFCSTEASGMLSICERTRKTCKRAKKYLAGLSHRRGDQMTLGPCKKQKRAFCLTAERRIPKETPPKEAKQSDDEDDGSGDGEAEESESDAEKAEAAESDDGDRFVLEDQIWLCYSSPDNCEQQRKNMFYFGFTNVSRCGRWR
jgi:hypothetical protein